MSNRWERVTDYSTLSFGDRIRIEPEDGEAIYAFKQDGLHWVLFEDEDELKGLSEQWDSIERRRHVTAEELAERVRLKRPLLCDTYINEARAHLDALRELENEE